MQRIFSILTAGLLLVVALGLSSCATEYVVSLPITVASGASATGFGDATTAGAQLTASATIDVAALAAANYIDPSKIKTVVLNYSYVDKNWWAVIYLSYSVNGGASVVFKVIDNGAGDTQATGTKTGSISIPYEGSGSITISTSTLTTTGAGYSQWGGVTAFGDVTFK